MTENDDEPTSRIEEIRNALHQAQVMRDVLQAEYDRLVAEQEQMLQLVSDPMQHQQGMDKMHKAIVALQLAIASMEQGLRKRQQVRDEFDKPES
jgi:hypothetical protein